MKISHNWLKDFVEFNESPNETAHLLTFLGLQTTARAAFQVAWTEVITAKVLEVTKHPNADKLRLCSVTDGARTYAIVCGAPNVAAGQTIPLAVIGAELPGGLSIKRAKIRGVESEGMICSEKELGLSDESNGIMVLPDSTELGKPLETVLGDNDTVLEVDITTNRPDCLSHWGVSREIAAKLEKPIRLPEPARPSVAGGVPITIEDNDLCQRYIGIKISGVTVKPSPDWLAKRLEKCGLRPINNIVDITNYVLLELGHPLHAFDLAKMAGGEIKVRRARKDEKIAALDGREYPLTEAMLVIADKDKPQAIAGVMGGESSGVIESTKDIILESALFYPPSIRRTSKALNLSTDASYRFERGTAWEVSEFASWRAADLILQLAGGTIEARTDRTSASYTPVKIDLRPARVKHLLNVDFSVEEIKSRLQYLGLALAESDGKLTCTIPSWRLDLKQEVDLIEELVRMRGYDAVPVTVLPIIPDLEEGKEPVSVENQLRSQLCSQGFSEALNYSFTQDEVLRRFKLTSAYRIANPLSKENEVLRPSLIPGLWKNFVLNIDQGFESVQLFETGTVFSSEGEKRTLGILVYGQVWPNWWGWEKRGITVPTYDFYFLSGIIAHLVPNARITVNKECAPYYHPGKTARIEINGAVAGEFGILRPEYCAEFNGEIGYAEFDLALLEKGWKRETPRSPAIRRFPPAKRDLSFVADKAVPFNDIVRVFSQAARGDSILREFTLFSRYEDPKLGENKVSYSFHLLFRHPDHTLTDVEVGPQVDAIVRRLNSELGITLR